MKGSRALNRCMACDCDIHRYLTDPTGHIIDYGRKRRLVTDIQFDLLLVRDHGCRWRGCNIPAAGCDAHHAKHWLDGGETNPTTSSSCAGTTTICCTNNTGVSSPSGPATSPSTHQTTENASCVHH